MKTKDSKTLSWGSIYFGSNDFVGDLFVKETCDRIDLLEKNVDELNQAINSINDLRRFLWCISFKKMISEIHNYRIENELRRRLIKLADSITIDHSSFVHFINDNYELIFEEPRYEQAAFVDFFTYLVSLCYSKYVKGIDQKVFRFLEEKYPLFLLSRFDLCGKYYSKHDRAFQGLFKGLKQTRPFDDQIYLRFLLQQKNPDDPFLAEQALFICERTVEAIEAMSLSEDSEEVLRLQSSLKDYSRLAVQYKLRCANDFRECEKRVGTISDKFIRKHGQHTRIGPFDLTETINELKKDDNPFKFLQLTHKSAQNGKIINVLDYILTADNKKNPLSELMDDIAMARSDKYPYFKQDLMRSDLWLRTRLIFLTMLDHQLANDFASYISNASHALQEKYFESLIDIEEEIKGEVSCLITASLMVKQKQSETPFGKALVFGTAMSICSTLEKMIRNIAYKEVKTERYFDLSKATLANFLTAPFTLSDLSEGLKYHLEFYLIKEVAFKGINEDKPGLNIRNDLMHGNDDAYERTDLSTCLILFYLLFSLINDLLITIGEADEKDENL